MLTSQSQNWNEPKQVIPKSKDLSRSQQNKVKLNTIVHFKRLGSRHIQNEIKLQKAMNGMDRILCITDLILIQRHTYKSNALSDVDFEAFLSPPMYLCGIYNFNERVFRKGGCFLLCNDLGLIL